MTDLSPPGGQTPTSAPEAERSHIESWDVFLSHNSRDKPVVERIALRLKRAGVEPWLDIWNLTPGGRWQDEIVEGLRATRACAIFIGPHGLGDWVREELAVALDRAAKDRAFRLFLVLLPGVSEPFDPTTLPPFLSTRTWVDMRAGADEPRGIQALINAVRGVAISPLVAVARDDSACPYRGLEVFEREHARYFFGRDADVQRLLEQLRDGRFLAVLGPSGSGKSSLVRAGLLPALADGRLPGSDRWPQRIFKPGARPLVELAAAITTLSPATAGSMQNTLDGLERDHRTLDLAVAFALSGAHADHRVVLLVDQFEEAFTLCRDDDERSAFFANLLYAARTPGGRCVVIVTMRADFYPHTAAWPELAQQVAHSQYLVSPLSSDGLYQAIVEPAHAVGLQFEEGLVETILADVNHQPGALPLLEHALLQLWEQRAGSMLTLEAYRRVGGVSGALARQADAIYAGLTPEQQELARHILLRLTQPGEGTEDTRRRASLAEIGNDSAMLGVIQTLVAARLLILSGNGTERSVDVAHEALIRGWPRLRGWIDEDRAGLREHRRITDAALEWDHLGRDQSALFRGARLATAIEWRDRNERLLNPLEREFLDASADLAADERRAARRRIRWTIAGLTAALAIISVAAVIAFIQRDAARSSAAQAALEADQRATAEAEAVAQRDAAEAARNLAFSRELAVNALGVIDSDSQLSLLLALEAVRVQPTDQALATLRQVLLETPLYRLASQDGQLSTMLALTSDGNTLVTGDSLGMLQLWDLPSGRLLGSWMAHPDVALYSVALSHDDRLLASADREGGVAVWELATQRRLWNAQIHTGAVRTLEFSPDDSLLLTTGEDGRAFTIDPNNGRELGSFGTGSSAIAVAAFDQDGDLVIYSNTGSPPAAYAARGGNLVMRFADADDDVTSITPLPDSTEILVSGFYTTMRVWDTVTGNLVRTVSNMDTPYAQHIAWIPGSEHFIIVGANGYAAIWDARTWTLVTPLVGHRAIVQNVVVSADGRLAATFSFDGVTRVWDTTTGTALAVLRGHQEAVETAVFSSSAPLIATASYDGTINVYRYDARDALPDDLVRLAEARITRDLTPAERALYLHEEGGE